MSRSRGIITLAVLAAIALLYLPVRHAEFVWDDLLNFQQMPWLRTGDQWKQIIFRGYNDWAYYFRPLIIAFFTLQIRLFDDAPGPMHLVSLAMHLLNTFIVGLLALRLRAACGRQDDGLARWLVPALPMLFFGLHPALVEAVVWVGCQFELALTLFVLLALLANLSIKSQLFRAIVVGILFFLSALSKESAVCFPFLLLCQDILLTRNTASNGFARRTMAFVRERGGAYIACVIAGLVYLGLRQWALGRINPLAQVHVDALANLQQACFLYLRYWALAIAPSGLNPLHPALPYPPDHLTVLSGLVDVAAIFIVIAAIFVAVRRRSAWAISILAFSVAIAPALHLGSINFDGSTYHERYAMLAIAALAVFVPTAVNRWPFAASNRVFSVVPAVACLAWLATSILALITVIPLWSSNLRLWEWALAVNPHAEEAKAMLFNAYDAAGRTGDARHLADRIMSDPVPCDKCVVNVANFALDQGDLALASIALDKVQASRQLRYDPRMLHSYLFGRARWLLATGQIADGKAMLTMAIEGDPTDPQPYAVMGNVLRSEGNTDEAERYMSKARALTLP